MYTILDYEVKRQHYRQLIKEADNERLTAEYRKNHKKRIHNNNLQRKLYGRFSREKKGNRKFTFHHKHPMHV